MTRARQFALLTMTAAAGFLAACGPKQVRTPEPDPKTATLVVLLPDPDGTVGRATASSKGPGKPASADLSGAREATVIGLNQPPTKITILSADEVQQKFSSLLSSLPPAAIHFTLHFRFESDELTPESRALMPDILRAVKERPVPEVVVTGHTDTTGSAASNVELGMKRATVVRAFLADAGVDQGSMEITSHGEAVPLVPTPDDTYEPRNRRVEITIK